MSDKVHDITDLPKKVPFYKKKTTLVAAASAVALAVGAFLLTQNQTEESETPNPEA